MRYASNSNTQFRGSENLRFEKKLLFCLSLFIRFFKNIIYFLVYKLDSIILGVISNEMPQMLLSIFKKSCFLFTKKLYSESIICGPNLWKDLYFKNLQTFSVKNPKVKQKKKLLQELFNKKPVRSANPAKI